MLVDGIISWAERSVNERKCSKPQSSFRTDMAKSGGKHAKRGSDVSHVHEKSRFQCVRAALLPIPAERATWNLSYNPSKKGGIGAGSLVNKKEEKNQIKINRINKPTIRRKKKSLPRPYRGPSPVRTTG